MPKEKTKNYISIPKQEYLKLKKLQKYFEGFIQYLEHVSSIRKARKDIKDGRTLSQEELFKNLGV